MKTNINSKPFSFEIDVDDDIYYTEGTFDGVICYSPGTMYRSNGDPGDPPEYESEVTAIYIDSCTMNDSDDEYVVDKDSELYAKIEAKCLELLDDEDI